MQQSPSTKKNDNEDLSFYLINKENNISKLDVLPNYLRKYNTEFNYLFSQIWNCAHAATELGPDQIYNFSNNMRKFFEVYTYFKYPSDQDKSVFREKFFDSENNLNHFKLVDRIAN
ncbi:AAA family ATPase, partial [Acinetobacter johnsonii]|uniref:AAA family ATPase n=1 Tax=Acinetobacter johnsonii TaxID=40214 RepID=UPI00244CFD06